MPKLKTKRGAAKRFKVTKSKRIKFTKSRRRHMLEDKSPKRSRNSRRAGYVHPADEKAMHRLLPYA